MNRKIFLLACMLGMAFNLQAKKSNYIYLTYKEFNDSTGEAFTDLSMMHVMATVTITFTTSSGKVKYSGKEIWGYMYKDKLFRSDKRTGQFAMLVSKGKIYYYENGWAHTLMVKNNSKKEEFAVGYYCYVSNSLKSPLTPFPSTGISDAKKLTKEFREKYPQHEPLFKAIGKNFTLANVRLMIQKYNKSEAKEEEDKEGDE